MGKKWYNKDKVKCPFYQYERDSAIVCDGIISDHMCSYFESASKKRAFQLGNCFLASGAECVIRETLDK